MRPNRVPGRCSALVVALLVPLTFASVAAASPTLTWFDGDGQPRWELPVTARSAAGAGPLLAPHWFRSLPRQRVPRLGGGVIDLGSVRGRVLILDFWASWCPPCLEELPYLDRLEKSLRDRGLTVVAVNAEEPEEHVRAFVDRVSLGLPVGLLTEELAGEFDLSRLPAVVLIDREGRIREQWSGTAPGRKEEITRAARALLDPGGGEVASSGVGRLLHDDGSLVPRWSKLTLSTITGLAVGRVSDGSVRMVVNRSRDLDIKRGDGLQLSRLESPLGAVTLRSAAGEGPGICGFRPGATKLALIDLETGELVTVSSPAPVLDVAWIGSAGDARLWGATTAGLVRLGGGAGGPPRGIGDEEGTLLSVAGVGHGGDTAALILTAQGTVRALAIDGAPGARFEAPSGAWKVVTAKRGDSGWGVLPREARQVVVGQFLVGGGSLIAFVLGEDRLRVVEVESGSVVLEAIIPDLGPLAAGDLDGDGRDELVVASGRRLIVFGGGGEAPSR